MLKLRGKPKSPETLTSRESDELLMLLARRWLLICRGHIQHELSTFDDVSNLYLCVSAPLCVGGGRSSVLVHAL